MVPPLNGALVDVKLPLNRPFPGKVRPNSPATYDSAVVTDVNKSVWNKIAESVAPKKAVTVRVALIPAPARDG